MRNGVQALADLLPNASLRTLECQTHMVKPAALAPVLVEFLKGWAPQSSRPMAMASQSSPLRRR